MDMVEGHAVASVTDRCLLIVLSFNGADDTIECLASIFRDKPATADVLVVDNASAPGTVAALRAAFPGVEILPLAENTGWAGGNNAGIALALQRAYGLICLLNNDLSINEGALARMIDAAGRLGPTMLHPVIHDYFAPEIAQHDISRWTEAMAGHPDIFPMTYAYGACLMVHAELFRRVGLFDERYFLQMEESDFYERAVRLGYGAHLCGSARVLHKESVSMGGKVSPLKTYYSVRNRLLFAEKHAGGLLAYAHAWRGMFWHLRGLAVADASPWRFLRWLGSSDPYATASRAGIGHYLTRRFGKMPDATARALRANSR